MNAKEILKEKKYIVGKHLIDESLKLGLSIEEFILLLYFENADSNAFDVEFIKKNTGLDDEKIMFAFNNLMSKQIISFGTDKDSEGRIVDGISLDNLYDLINAEIENKNKKESEINIFETFEKEFVRTLSSSEYEYINGFLSAGFSEELILGALKEAVYNGVNNMRYIDTVLHDWKRKGYKTMDDVKNNIKTIPENNSLLDTELLEFDWLNDD